MKSTFGRIALAAAAAGLLTGCVKIPGMPGYPGTPAAPASPAGANGAGAGTEASTPGTPAYEEVMVPGSAQVLAGVIRLNTSTGQTATAFGAPAQLVNIPDPPIPTGQYHLMIWAQPAGSDGSISWGAARVDKISGRTWILNGGGSNPFSWIELTPTAK